jgi:uncharacterized membrane protein
MGPLSVPSVISCLKTLVVILLLDTVFFVGMKRYFEDQIIAVQKTMFTVKYEGVLFTYFMMAMGIQTMIIDQQWTPWEAAWWGLVVYGIYEGTNYSIFKNWKWSTVCMDTLWGAVLVGTTVYVRKEWV